MTYLIIDTSTDLCLIALADERRIISEQAFSHFNLLSKNLLPSIQQLLEANNVFPSDLSFIAAGIGPGSYTGTRLGASVAKSLAFGLNIHVKPFHSPLAFLPDSQGTFAFLLPTRAGLYFVLTGASASTQVDQKSAGLVPSVELLSAVQAADYLICPPSLTLPEELKEKLQFNASPNLSALTKYLLSVEAQPPENIELQYLHTPL